MLKKLYEQRAEKQSEMEALLNAAKTEERAMSTEETEKFDALEKEIQQIDGTIDREERARKIEKKEPKKTEVEERAVAEERAFENYIRGIVEERADVSLTTADNGAIIPSTIANKIIEKVVEICPIYELSDRYNVGGTLTIPRYDEETQAITMAYASEFAELESTSGKMVNIELKGFLAGALTKVSKSLINNSNFQLVNFVIKRMGESIAKFIEGELLNGTTDKVSGLATGVTLKVTAAAAQAITADELIDTQEKVADIYQANSIWIMNRDTRTAIRKLKDGQGNYLLNKDYNSKWGYTLLGKDVYTSSNMPTMAAGKKTVYYGDMSGLAVKVAENVSIEVLREKFATQHAVGVVGWVELDAKVQDTQKLSVLEMAAS